MTTDRQLIDAYITKNYDYGDTVPNPLDAVCVEQINCNMHWALKNHEVQLGDWLLSDEFESEVVRVKNGRVVMVWTTCDVTPIMER